jgi:hypothetical protein
LNLGRKLKSVEPWCSQNYTYSYVPARQCRFDDKGKVHWWQPKSLEKPIVPESLQTRIDHAVSWVLNPLSHSQSVDRYRVEIEDAIYAIDDLQSAVKRAVTAPTVRHTVALEELVSLLTAYISKMKSEKAGNTKPSKV